MTELDDTTDLLNWHAERLRETSMHALLAAEPDRAARHALRVGPLYANFARQKYDASALDALLALAQTRGVTQAIQRLFAGDVVNTTEQRPALHMALRGEVGQQPRLVHAAAAATAARAQMFQLIDELKDSPVTDIISVGIGGSDLGPRLAVDALRAAKQARFRVHFVSNVDGVAMERVLADLDPARTAGILISKTFGTQETLLNGHILHDWLGSSERLYAVSANGARVAQTFAIPPTRILPMWDWVGGRYSLWSAVGFPVALAIGVDRFQELLAGAAAMDAHVLDAPLEANLAVRHALTSHWNRNGLGYPTQAIMAYDQRLALFPAYLQQLMMESLGKQVLHDGTPVHCATVPVWWGGVGTDVQHSFFQALHQGTSIVPVDFIGTVAQDDPYCANHQALNANLLAQMEALANGQSCDDPHRCYRGGRPSTVFLLDALTPHALGSLIALYEHSVYVQSVIWGINAFDQFGVELGKQLANRLLPALSGATVALDDPITRELVAQLRNPINAESLR